ncbi:MAG: type II toxin-antitoxin system RelE/ParE family toxin [Polynucleobacter sp.]|nr:type II toxin-antitoxin system RelE/ParE family toxin [Polynucleobacter sp.]
MVELWVYLAKKNLSVANKALDIIARETQTLSVFPFMGRLRPEIKDDIRSWPSETKYIFFYLFDHRLLKIVRVLHHTRDSNKVEFNETTNSLGTIE